MSGDPKLENCPQCGEGVAVECNLYGMVSVKATHLGGFADGHRLNLLVCTKCGQVIRMFVDNPEKLLVP